MKAPKPTESGELVTRPDRLPADENPALVYLGGLAESSRRVMRGSLRRIAAVVAGEEVEPEAIPWERVRWQHAAKIKQELQERYAPATVNRHLSALRGVLKAAWKLGLMEESEYRLAADVESLSFERLPDGRRVSLQELYEIGQVCEDDDSPAGARDWAMIAVMARGGLRRSEVVNLDLSDVVTETEGEEKAVGLTVRGGKGRKDREVYLANGAKGALLQWLEVRGREPGPLFWPVTKSGEPEPRRMTAQAVYNRLQRRQEQAEVEPFTPHDLRRTAASDLLEHGADLATVADLLGHASTDTTRRYDRRGEAAKRRAAVQVPF